MYQMLNFKKTGVYVSIIFAICLITLGVFTPKVKAMVEPTQEFYVNDYANVLSDETEKYIIEKSKALNEIDGTQIVVVTIESLEGRELEEYSLELAKKFKIGDKNKNNGLLLLLSIGDRKSRIEVGLGLEGILPDGKTGRFQDDYMIPYYSKDNWNEGILNGYKAFYEEISTKNNLNLEHDTPVIQKQEKKSEEMIVVYVAISIVVGIFLGKEWSISQRVKYANSDYFKNNSKIKDMIKKYEGLENKKPSIIKIIIYLAILIATGFIGYIDLGPLTIVCMLIFFGIAIIPQFPSNRLTDDNDDDTSYGGGSFGGGSFGGGSSGGGGSFGGGGSSRSF